MNGKASLATGLAARFVRHVVTRGLLCEGDRVVVAVSGGPDSTALLHLLRFAPGLPAMELLAAHFDHRMRADSAADADWLRGLTRAWDLDFRLGAAKGPLEGEEAAREARYAFLQRIAQDWGAAKTVTGHHEDDQAETVLFRIARGTGLAGLSGIPEVRAPGIVRPLLPFGREEIEAYLKGVGLIPRTDSSNLDARFSRNVLRNEIVPRLEEAVAPGARRSLVRLARIAREDEEGWSSILPDLLEGVLLGEEAGRVSVDRPALLAYHSAVQARLLRALVERFGVRLDEAGTRAMLEFASLGASGRGVRLPGSVELQRSFDQLIVSAGRGEGEHRPLEIPEPGSGRGDFVVGGRRMTADWSTGEPPSGRWVERFALSQLEFPASLREWGPGDRVRLPYGSKKLKKIFAEARVPAHERSREPVLVDRRGSVLWIPGLIRSSDAEVGGTEAALSIAVGDDS